MTGTIKSSVDVVETYVSSAVPLCTRAIVEGFDLENESPGPIPLTF